MQNCLRGCAKLFLLTCWVLVSSGCNLPGFSSSVATQAPSTISVNPSSKAPETLITFHVDIPAKTPPEETILLSILDEVTGLALNAQRLTMESGEDNQFILSIPFQIGSIVKYRYSRRGNFLSEEHTPDGRPVRYRLYLVEGPGEIYDVVTRWNDTLYQGPSGRITGQVKSANSDNPIPNLLVTAGGLQTLTKADGFYHLEGLPPGTHNLVVYALDGSFTTFQQGALVEAGSTTPALIEVSSVPSVDLTFFLNVPKETIPSVPIRLVGNLIQMGNSFANLSGGINSSVSQMPSLSPLPDGRYGLILSLPVGIDIRYKYTLGDGFWNAERTNNGGFHLRQLIIPDDGIQIEDTVETWGGENVGHITFDVTVPETTPPSENVSLQLNPYGWTEPLPMWNLGENRWGYMLFGPLDLVKQIGYRFCRSEQCGYADDLRTPGDYSSGQVIKTSSENQTVQYEVDDWAWLETNIPPITIPNIEINPRGEQFITGIELQPKYHPSWGSRTPALYNNMATMTANTLIIAPTWVYSSLDPPVLEIIPGKNPLWHDLNSTIYQAQFREYSVVIRPTPQFPTSTDEWWTDAPIDFPWWVSWFDNYRSFILHHALLAAQTGAESLILGGEWLEPALPGGRLLDGSPSGVPADANVRWKEIIYDVRKVYSGNIAWALPLPHKEDIPFDFLQDIDQLYILWSAPLAADLDSPEEDLVRESTRILEKRIYPFWKAWIDSKSEEESENHNSIILSLAYPSAEGGIIGCLPDPILKCISPETLNYPVPDFPMIKLDMEEQAEAYIAVLSAMNNEDWIDGFVTRGYYYPVILQDKSTSVQGKYAAEVLGYWFTSLLGR